MRKSFYWPHMANDVYNYVERCQSSQRSRKIPTHQCLSHLFLAERLLKLVSMDIPGPLPRPKIGNRYLVVLTHRNSKLTSAIPTKKMTVTDVAQIFVDQVGIRYGMPAWLLLGNGFWFVANFFYAVCISLESKLMTTTSYHPLTNGQTERYKKTYSVDPVTILRNTKMIRTRLFSL